MNYRWQDFCVLHVWCCVTNVSWFIFARNDVCNRLLTNAFWWATFWWPQHFGHFFLVTTTFCWLFLLPTTGSQGLTGCISRCKGGDVAWPTTEWMVFVWEIRVGLLYLCYVCRGHLWCNCWASLWYGYWLYLWHGCWVYLWYDGGLKLWCSCWLNLWHVFHAVTLLYATILRLVYPMM